jgi:hypothetical protein
MSLPQRGHLGRPGTSTDHRNVRNRSDNDAHVKYVKHRMQNSTIDFLGFW